MPATRTTRRGTGAGWGGPANGAGQPPGNKLAGRPVGVKDGEGKRALALAALQEAAPLAVQTVIDLAQTKTDPRALQAALAVLKRIGLHEKAALEHSGTDGGPIETKVTVRIVRPDDGGPGGV
jgi:hypothetical protein